MGPDTDGMGMPTQACPLVNLTRNDPDPPLYPGIGSAHWHVPVAQEYFDQGLRFFFAFNNRESYRAFRKAASEAEARRISCSACYWAQALPLGVDLNMSKQVESDRDAANNALFRATKANPSPEESLIIQALFARYQDCAGTARWECQKARNQGYYSGMKRVLEAFGKDDPNIITLFADSAMNLTPWNYWYNDGHTVRAEIPEARTYLEVALNLHQYPQNEGPVHWYIHLMEGSTTPGAAKPYADLLAPSAPSNPLAPNAGHLVHMPSHIYYRIGDMRGAIEANREAIEADEAYFAREPNLYRPDGDRYKYGYYPHNIHFLLAAAVLSGDEPDVSRYAEELLQSLPDKGNGLRADEYRSAYYFARLNFSSTADIRNFARPSPFNLQPIANLAYDFTQLMADIWDGKKSSQWADKLEADLGEYRKTASDADKPNANCEPPPPGIQLQIPRDRYLCLATILHDLGRARTAASNADWDKAVAQAQHAVDIQRALRYDEPPLWLYPTRQTLASILIQRADAVGPTEGRQYLDEAKQKLLESLNEQRDANPDEIPVGTNPGNGWAYYGLLEIAKRNSPADVGRATLDLKTHWFGAPGFHTLDRM